MDHLYFNLIGAQASKAGIPPSSKLLIICALLAAWPLNLGAQRNPKAGARALAVVEALDLAPTGAAPSLKKRHVSVGASPTLFNRLYPIVIFINDNYYDASLYKARPVPMALEPGTVYEVQRAGEPLGLFTVQQPEKYGDVWLANGRWQSKNALAEAKPVDRGAARALSSADDERPRLRRPGNAAGAQAQQAGSPTGNVSAAEGPVADPDRPKLTRRRPAAAPASSKVNTRTSSSSKAISAEPGSSPRGEADGAPRIAVAVSDATPYEPRDYKAQLNQEETSKFFKWARTQAEEVALRHAREISQRYRKAAPSENVQIRVFDLFRDNNFELVLTAHQRFRRIETRASRPPLNNELDVFVTLVAKSGYNAELTSLFSRATDDAHLDVNGRMDLIDAVDADGDGSGELLFREVGPSKRSFQLYRVGRDQLWKLFASAESSR